MIYKYVHVLNAKNVQKLYGGIYFCPLHAK